MNALLNDLRAALPSDVDPLDVLVDYVGDHPDDREAFGLLIEAAFEEGHRE